MTVRPATAADAEAIWQIFKAVVAGGDTYVFAPDTPRQVALDYYLGANVHSWVAEEDGCIHGFATIGPSQTQEADGTNVGELYGLYVDPATWRRGYGRLLIAHARNLLVERGFIEAVLWVLRGNERAEAFYRADGWSKDGAERDDDIGPGWRAASTASCDIPVIHELRYRRRL